MKIKTILFLLIILILFIGCNSNSIIQSNGNNITEESSQKSEPIQSNASTIQSNENDSDNIVIIDPAKNHSIPLEAIDEEIFKALGFELIERSYNQGLGWNETVHCGIVLLNTNWSHENPLTANKYLDFALQRLILESTSVKDLYTNNIIIVDEHEPFQIICNAPSIDRYLTNYFEIDIEYIRDSGVYDEDNSTYKIKTNAGGVANPFVYLIDVKEENSIRTLTIIFQNEYANGYHSDDILSEFNVYENAREISVKLMVDGSFKFIENKIIPLNPSDYDNRITLDMYSPNVEEQ